MKKTKSGKTDLPFFWVCLWTVFCCTLFEGQSLPVFSETEDGTPLLILSYGDISSTESNKSVVSLDTLKSDIEFLSEAGYVFINSADLIAYKQGLSPLPEKAVWLTFDDGFESVYTLVYPLFQEKGIKGGCVCSGKLQRSLLGKSFGKAGRLPLLHSA